MMRILLLSCITILARKKENYGAEDIPVACEREHLQESSVRRVQVGGSLECVQVVGKLG